MSKKMNYTNGEITIVWEPGKGLPDVFKPKEKPWIKIDAATTDEMVKQVKACPSGALSYYLNDKKTNKRIV